MTVDDATLFAFLDGSLPPPQRESVEAAIAADPALAERVARHRAIEAAARASFAGELLEPVPDPWIAAIDEALLGPDARTASLAAARERRRGSRLHWWTGGAAAAGLAIGLVAATTLGTGEGRLVAERGDVLVASAAVGDALDNARSGVPFKLDDHRSVDVQLSLVTPDGRYCREALVADEGRSDRIVACQNDGAWRIAGLSKGEAGAAGYETASGAGSLDALVQDLGGEALDGQAEAEAIRKGWR